MGIADTVRSIMNNETPLTAVIGYAGPNFEAASQDDLTTILNSLFNFQTDDGTFAYRQIVSPDLCVLGEDGCTKPKDGSGNATVLMAGPGTEWKSKGFLWLVRLTHQGCTQITLGKGEITNILNTGNKR